MFAALTFPRLINPGLVGEDATADTEDDVDELYSVRVDSKHLIQFINASLINPNQVVCSIVEDICLNMFVYLGGTEEPAGCITYEASFLT